MSVEPSLAGEALSHTATVVFIVVGFVLIIVGSVGNVLIVATILVNKTLRVLHNVFVVNLAVADFLVTAYFLPLQVSAFVDGKYPVSDSSACQFVGFSIVWLFVTSLLSIAAISINRFIKVCHQRVYHQIFSKTNTLLACGAVWVLAFLCTFPPLVGWGRFHFDEKNHYCGFDRSADLGYTLFLLCVSIALPAALIFICNFAIYRHVLLSKRRVMSFATGTQPKLSDASVPASKPTTGQGTGSVSDLSQTSQDQSHPSTSKAQEESTIHSDSKKKSVTSERRKAVLTVSFANDVRRFMSTHKQKTISAAEQIESNEGCSQNTSSVADIEPRVVPTEPPTNPSARTHARGRSPHKLASGTSTSSVAPPKLGSVLTEPPPDPAAGTSATSRPLHDHKAAPRTELDLTSSSSVATLNQGADPPNPSAGTSARSCRTQNYPKAASTTEQTFATSSSSAATLKPQADPPNQSAATLKPEADPPNHSAGTSASSCSTQHYPKAASRTELAFVKSTFVIFISFSILMSPYMICALGDRRTEWPALVHIICSYTSYAHCCVNCVVYGFMSRQFRNGYKTLMMKLRCWESVAVRRQRLIAALRNPTNAARS